MNVYICFLLLFKLYPAGYSTHDGNLVTGQQNFSGLETAEKIIEALCR